MTCPTNCCRLVASLIVSPLFLTSCSSSGVDQSVLSADPQSPSVSLSADPLAVDSGGLTSLTWTASNANECLASGAWSGSRPTNGQENAGPLVGDNTYTLVCNGSGGEGTATITISVVTNGQAGVQGTIDSGFTDRWGQNRVYLFMGHVEPDDFDGDNGDPVMSIPVDQTNGTCAFTYDQFGLAAGDYTLAFTNDAGEDDPSTQDDLRFVGSTEITVDNDIVPVDFHAGSIVRVGPQRQFVTIAEAAAAAKDGDVVEIDAGVYPADVAIWNQDNLTLRGIGGYAHVRSDGANAQGKALWVIVGNNTLVENIEFSGVSVPDRNGAGIRLEGQNLTICNGYFHDNDEGILGGLGDVLIEYSEFADNGYGDGFSHNIYILDAERFMLRHSYIHHAHVGHNVKSRARENYIYYNRIMDEDSGDSSYAIDIPNGGLSFVIGNVVQQGIHAQNSSMVNYGSEGLFSGRTHHLYLVNNSMVDDYGGTFVQAAKGTVVATMINNVLVGNGNELTGVAGILTTNLKTTAPQFADIDNFDYRLTGNSPARNAGSSPGERDGTALIPVFQYVHSSNREERPTNDLLDIGAYEYVP